MMMYSNPSDNPYLLQYALAYTHTHTHTNTHTHTHTHTSAAIGSHGCVLIESTMDTPCVPKPKGNHAIGCVDDDRMVDV